MMMVMMVIVTKAAFSVYLLLNLVVTLLHTNDISWVHMPLLTVSGIARSISLPVPHVSLLSS